MTERPRKPSREELEEINSSVRYAMFSAFALATPLGDADRDALTAEVEELLGAVTQAAREAGRGRIARSRAMLHAYFAALQREPRSARVFLVEIRGVSRAVDQAFDAALRSIGREVARIVAPPGAPEDELLQAGVVGGVIHIALRWIDDGYAPDIERVVDTALRLGAVLSHAPRRRGG